MGGKVITMTTGANPTKKTRHHDRGDASDGTGDRLKVRARHGSHLSDSGALGGGDSGHVSALRLNTHLNMLVRGCRNLIQLVCRPLEAA